MEIEAPWVRFQLQPSPPTSMFAILHCPRLGDYLLALLLALVFNIYLITVYILTPMFITTLPQPWRTAIALSWALCQPLFSLGVCLLIPHTSLTWATLVVELVMFVSYTCGIIFASWSTGLTGRSHHMK